MRFRACHQLPGHLSCLLAIVGIFLFVSGCASPHMSSELQSGRIAFESGDYFRAFRELLPVARKGRPEAQYAVGYMYYYGLGVPQNMQMGVYWINAAVLQGYAPAREALDMIYHHNTKNTNSQSLKHVSVTRLEQKQTARKRYVLQFYGSYSFASVKHLRKAPGFQKMETVKIYHTKHGGRDWYVLALGDFHTVVAAQNRKNSLQSHLKNFHPWIREREGLEKV